MYTEEFVRNFVKRRQNFRNMDPIGTALFLAYALIMRKVEMSDMGIKLYNASVVLFVLAGFPLYHYVSRVLSTCPVCHTLLKTMPPNSKHKYWRIGNGPLPDRCPHCNTDFEKYKR